MTKTLLIFVLLLAGVTVSSFAKGDRKAFQVYDFSKGLDSYHNPRGLPEGFVQDALNVFFDDKSGVTKRSGFSVAWSTKSYSYTGLWTYTDATNTAWQVARSSDQITASNLAGITVIIATVSANDVVGETNAFGNAYFVDQTQGVYYWNGSVTTFVASSPKGSIITQFHNRLWVTGAAVPNGNQLYGSAYYDGTTWTTGLNATDPVQYSIGLNDNFDNVTAEYVYLDTLYIFKHYSIFGLYGFDQTNFQISQLTQECGCVDGGTIQTYNGGLKFVSMRGVEDFNGYLCRRISDPIKNKIDPAIQSGSFSQQSWNQSTNADFSTWTTVQLDTASLTNQVQLAGRLVDSFPNLNNWTQLAGAWTASGNTAVPVYSASPSVLVADSIVGLPGNWREGVSASFTQSDTGGAIAYVGMVNASNQGYVFSLEKDLVTQKNDVSFWKVDGTALTVLFDHGLYGPADSNYHFMEVKRLGTDFQAYLDGTLVAESIDGSYTGLDRPYIRCDTKFSGVTCNGFKNFAVGATSGTFVTPYRVLTPIDKFANFIVDQNLSSGGNISYTICTASTSGGAGEVCSSAVPNSQIVNSTNNYVRVKGTFTTAVSTDAPKLNNFAVQWYSGTRAPPMSSTVWDNRYWVALATTTSDAANDAVLVLNSHGAWSMLDLHAGAFTQYKNSLYHADSQASGNIYLDNTGSSDNGSSINASVTTADLSLGDLASDDYLYAIYPSIANDGACAVSISYDMDHSGNFTSLGSPAESEFSTTSAARLPFPIDSSHQDFGQSVRFKIGTNDGACAFNLLGLEGLYRSRPLQ